MKSKNPQREPNADILVVGGGHAGLTQTLLLALCGFNVTCIDPSIVDLSNDKARDKRTTALSYGSMQVMRAAGIWDKILPHSCPIKDIKILDGSSPVLLNFAVDDIANDLSGDNTADAQKPAFGWIVENHILRYILHDAITQNPKASLKFGQTVTNFTHHNDGITAHLKSGENITAKLVIGADGRRSFTRQWAGINVREWSYRQRAIIARVTHANPHNNIAVEHFKTEGPFAILPMQNSAKGAHQSALVWTQDEKTGDDTDFLNCDKDIFITALNARFPDFYGQVLDITDRMSYPLTLIHAYDYIAPRIALVADAAHGIHPIAGQGLNLGLRDVAALCEILQKARQNKCDIGGKDILDSYQRARRFDNTAMAATTDILNKLFGTKHLLFPITRKIGLKMIEHIHPAKRFFMRQAMGVSGQLPDMIKTGKLK